MNILSYLPLAFAEAAAPQPFMQFIPLVLIFVIFYFLLIAPMRKRQKALQQLVENLQKGDKVITNGGLHGEVSSVQEKIVILKIADNVKVRIAKSAVAGMEGQEDGGR